MALANPLGYDIVDATNAWTAAGKVFATKTDNTVRSEADMATRAGQKWADTVSYALERTRQVFNGALQVPGPFIVDPAADAVAGDARAGADDLIIGSLTTANNGMTILSTTAGKGSIEFTDAAATAVGGLVYDHTEGRLQMDLQGTAGAFWFYASGLSFATDNSVQLGFAAKRASDLHTMQGTVYGNLTLSAAGPQLDVGIDTGEPNIRIRKSAGDNGNIQFLSSGLRDWYIQNDGSEAFNIVRFVAGALQDTPLAIANATGDVTIANDLRVNGGVLNLAQDDFAVTVGNALGTPNIVFDKLGAETSYLQFQADSGLTNAKRIRHETNETLVVGSYNGSTWDDVIGVGSNAVGFFATTPVAQRADPGATTDNTGGTGPGSCEAVSGSGDDTTINNNFAQLTAKVNNLRAVLRDLGLAA